MRLYVPCQFHPNERVYLKFVQPPTTRAQIPHMFSVTCPQGLTGHYTNKAVIAEEGATPLVAAGIGALLVFLDPVVGIVASIVALVRGAKEQRSVEDFNRS